MSRVSSTIGRARAILRRDLAALVLVQSVAAGLFFAASHSFHLDALTKMAVATTRTLHTTLGQGRFSEGLDALGSLTPDDFLAVGLLDREGNLLASRGSAAQRRLLSPGLLDGNVQLPIRFREAPGGDLQDGLLVFLYDISASLRNGLLGVLVMALLTIPLFIHMHARLRNLFFSVIEAEKDVAVARMMQMLAHDVRKPFSMLKMTLETLWRAQTLERVKELTSRAMPDIDRAMRATNGLIQDVMEIGSQREPALEPVAVESLVEVCLSDLLRVYPKADVAFSYEFRQTREVRVESVKVLRVFANIIGNGLDAMDGRGQFRISARDVVVNNEMFVEISIANDGPSIPPEVLPQLFETFFSSGKKGGTGLGLAIAQKIVRAHGGEIRVTSDPGQWVCFAFTLRAGSVLHYPDLERLPRHSLDVLQDENALPQLDESHVANSESVLELELRRLTDGKRLVVASLDDEALYRALIADHLSDLQSRFPEIALVSCAEEDELLQATEREKPLLALVDVDLGRGKPSGFDVVRTLRAKGFSGFICIHSNRLGPEVHKEAGAAGADAFLSKPMGRVHLLTLLCQAVQVGAPGAPMVPAAPSEPEPLERDLVLAVIDDDELNLMFWRAEYPDAHTYTTPEEFLEALSQESVDFDVIVTDHYFGSASSMTGLDLGKALEGKVSAALLLSSNVTHAGDEYARVFAAQIGKRVPQLGELRAWREGKSSSNS